MSNWTRAHRMRLDATPYPARQTKLSNRWIVNEFSPSSAPLAIRVTKQSAARIFRHNWAQRVEPEINLHISNFITAATKRIKGQQVATIELREQWIIVVVAAAIHSTHSAGRPHADLTGTVYRSSGTYYIQCTKTLDISTKPTPEGRPKQKKKKRKSEAELKKRLNRVNNYSVEILNSNNRHCSLLCALCAVRCGAVRWLLASHSLSRTIVGGNLFNSHIKFD